MNPVVACEGIRKTYRMGETVVEALRDVTLQVESGEFVALRGPSGSGKTTLLNIVGFLDEPDDGSYRFRGATCDTRREQTLIRRHEIGFVFQSFNLIPVMTAFENIEYPLLLAGQPKRLRHAAVYEALDAVGIGPFGAHLPDRLSGGQRQRVTIARALVKKPALVIADEPTASLDTATAQTIVELMKSLAHETGASFLIATHDDRMSAHCDRVVTMSDGRVAP